MSLNAANHARRMNFLGGTDMAVLMSGDAERIHNLWLEKIGQRMPDDLSDNLPVQLGKWTEPFNLDWCARKLEKQSQQPVTIIRRGEVVEHLFFPWARVTLDGWIEQLRCPVEAKHVGGNEPIEVIEDRYQPQMQWQMEVTGAQQVAFSVLVSNNRYVLGFVKRDPQCAAGMVELGAKFWRHVTDRTPPVDLPTVPDPINANKVYDMEELRSNEWAEHSNTFLTTREAARQNDEAKALLKMLVPPDASRCFGYGTVATRSKAGVISVREAKVS